MSFMDKFIKSLSFLSLVFLVFITGSLMTHLEVFPYRFLYDNYYRYVDAWNQRAKIDGASIYIWPQATVSYVDKGTRVWKQDDAYNGLTLYVFVPEPQARLIDMEGNTLWTWQKPLKEVMPYLEDRYFPNDMEMMTWRGLHLYPNGDLLVAYNGDINQGSLVRLDKNSNILWVFDDYVHHHVEVGADGLIYVPTYRIRTERMAAAPQLPEPMIEDIISVLDADGNLVREISVQDAFVRSPAYKTVLNYLQMRNRTDVLRSASERGDYMHLNAIEYITADAAARHERFEEGHLLLSFREIDTLAVLDPDTETIVWAVRGFWRAQHSPELLENGNILLFDNQGISHPDNLVSRIVEYNPDTGGIEWSYSGSDEAPFYSEVRGQQRALPNGNVLVTEFQNGRIFEVSQDGDIVWDFLVPEHLPGKTDRVAGVHDARRYKREYLQFLGEK